MLSVRMIEVYVVQNENRRETTLLWEGTRGETLIRTTMSVQHRYTNSGI